MKRIALLCTFLTVTTAGQAQIVLENFEYPAGQLTAFKAGADVSGGIWDSISGTAGPVQVVDGNLSLPGSFSSGIGRMVQLAALTGSGEDVAISFSSLGAGTTVYASMLISVDDLTGLAPHTNTVGDYFAMFMNATSSTSHYARLQVRVGTDPTTFQMGIRASSSNAATVWYDSDLVPGHTYAVAVGLDLVSGTANDVARLWVDPAPASVPPTPAASQVSAGDATTIARLGLRQGTTGSPVSSTTPNVKIDGIRISEVWGDVALPVQLLSFTAIRCADGVCLSWSTASEVDNYGFWVERRPEGTPEFSEVPRSFVPGHATTLEPRRYTFTDEGVTPGAWYYRLRQVDLDGAVRFSETVTIEIATAVTEETPCRTALDQNYPNPFNPSTDIRFTLARPERVRLRVYDMLGREVALLADGIDVAGEHRARFTASGLPSGAYVYVLEAGTYRAVKTMLFLK